MLLFGHPGLTLGAAALVAGAVSRRRADQARKESWFALLSRHIDVRLLVIGSLLPDIIDKPLGQYFFRDTFNNGRIFAHTLLFLILISAAGYFIYKRQHRLWMLTLAAGALTHLIMDEMWKAPRTIFWPLRGFTFEQEELTGWAANILHVLFSYPRIYVPEAIGLAIIIWFGVWVVSRKKVGVFIRYGRI